MEAMHGRKVRDIQLATSRPGALEIPALSCALLGQDHKCTNMPVKQSYCGASHLRGPAMA